jgi:hypothetical protein
MSEKTHDQLKWLLSAAAVVLTSVIVFALETAR